MGRKQPEERNGSFGRNGAAGAAAAATIRHTQKEPQKDGKGSETFRGRRTSGVGGFGIDLTLVLRKRYLREVALQIGRELLSTKGCDYSLPSSAGTWPEPTLYVVTPTYRRPEQLAELTRMAQTLMHVRNLVWLVIEDANLTTPLVTKLLDRTGIEYHHMIAPMPEQFRKKKVKPRGVSNRNRGLEWIRANATKGVLYFADDDNTYDISLFQEKGLWSVEHPSPVGKECVTVGQQAVIPSKVTLPCQIVAVISGDDEESSLAERAKRQKFRVLQSAGKSIKFLNFEFFIDLPLISPLIINK
ncbi:hypothetical protein RUM43_011834 [Polyplax serrata]|uniref:Galactosylgalactosylxylosylprotein 3-beta-glucuronosyltransferase n=1 Tax=Polyplax serrata TaxID=468196 RepID=A0AAN8P6J8_POLSC